MSRLRKKAPKAFSLARRVYADALAVSLREPQRFSSASRDATWKELEDWIRSRAADYLREFRCGASTLEDAIEQAGDLLMGQVCGRRSVAQRPPSEHAEKRVRTPVLLNRAARSLLRANGQEAVLRVRYDDAAEEILRWRLVSLALPPSILVASVSPARRPLLPVVRLLDESMAPDLPVAHHHVHHAAVGAFEEVWEGLRLRALLRPGELMEGLCDLRASCPGLHRRECPVREHGSDRRREAKRRPSRRGVHRKHMARWSDLICQAFVAEGLISRHLDHQREGIVGKCELCLPVLKRELRWFRRGAWRPYRARATRYPWQVEAWRMAEALREAGKAEITGMGGLSRQAYLERLMRSEVGLISRVFRYLLTEEEVSPDPELEVLFLQYLRVKTAVFGRLVHSPGEAGLEEFLEHFQQIKVYAPDLEGRRPIARKEPGLRVESTEYRVAPDAWFGTQRRKSRPVEAPAPGGSQVAESAWLVHLKREGSDGGVPLFGASIRNLERDGHRIIRALAGDPKRLKWLRGIDLCGVEEAQPLWVAAETIRRVRAESRRIVGRSPHSDLHPLGLTLHVGEDFRWLTSGVRAVAEPFVWGLIERGDRLGHGIAVTLEPKRWWKDREDRKDDVVSVKRIDRFLDLAFLAEYTEPRTGERSPNEKEWLDTKVREALDALRLGGQPAAGTSPIDEARALWRALGTATTRKLGTSWRPADLKLHEQWIRSYLWNRSTQKLADEKVPLIVEAESPECGLLEKARNRLVREMARMQVCIEWNPSSNFVVRGLEAVGAAQDLLRRRATENDRTTEKDSDGLETPTWTISTDDPITFATTLADEYAYAWAGMVCGDPFCDPSYARGLLDEAAATSMRMRFTLPRESRETERRRAARR